VPSNSASPRWNYDSRYDVRGSSDAGPAPAQSPGGHPAHPSGVAESMVVGFLLDRGLERGANEQARKHLLPFLVFGQEDFGVDPDGVFVSDCLNHLMGAAGPVTALPVPHA
jgi:hypothetical protein